MNISHGNKGKFHVISHFVKGAYFTCKSMEIEIMDSVIALILKHRIRRLAKD